MTSRRRALRKLLVWRRWLAKTDAGLSVTGSHLPGQAGSQGFYRAWRRVYLIERRSWPPVPESVDDAW